mgnify:CR=1 FL=1
MLPETALRSDATFDGAVLRHPLREGQPVLSLQIAENTLEQEQQIASVMRTTQRIDQPKKTSAPAFVPYKTAAPIPAILASTQSEVTHHAAKDLNTQTPAPKQSELMKEIVSSRLCLSQKRMLVRIHALHSALLIITSETNRF